MDLFVHRAAPGWGRAILAFEQPRKRGYQFEDGRLRLFREGFYDMLELVEDLDETEVRQVVEQLKAKIDASQERRALRKRSGVPTTSTAQGFERQLELFVEAYPEGFSGKPWLEGVRGQGTRALKRHLDPNIQRARQLLTLEACDDPDTFWDRLVQVTDGTSMVPAGQVRKLKAATPDMDVVAAWRDVLFDDGEEDGFALRFARLESTMRKVARDAVTWQVLTAPLALLHPERHVCVQPPTLKRQAKALGLRIPHQKRPSAPLYAQYVEMTRDVSRRLAEAGQTPADLLDVLEFAIYTLAPSRN